MSFGDLEKLNSKSREIRKMLIEEIHNLGKGHYGGSLSIVDILVLLYNVEMNIDVTNPGMENRDEACIVQRSCGAGFICGSFR